MTPVLTAIELTKRYGDVTAADRLSFDLEAGRVTGFLGPNGAGKTTTLRVLLGLARPSGGPLPARQGRGRARRPRRRRPARPSMGAAVLLAWTLAFVVAATVRGDRSDV